MTVRSSSFMPSRAQQAKTLQSRLLQLKKGCLRDHTLYSPAVPHRQRQRALHVRNATLGGVLAVQGGEASVCGVRGDHRMCQRHPRRKAFFLQALTFSRLMFGD